MTTKEKQKEAMEAVTEVRISINPQIMLNKNGRGGKYITEGILEDEYSTDPALIERMKGQIEVEIFNAVTPEQVASDLEQINGLASGKAWATSVLFWHFTDETRKTQGNWKALYEKWRPYFNKNSESTAERDRILSELGMPKHVIQRSQRGKIKIKLAIGEIQG